MKSFFNKLKKNTGFSLVEVLVAMTVLAVISIPLIRSFVISANINKKAKRLQNATDIAQDISEYFTQISLSDLHARYENDVTLREKYLKDDNKGVLVFQNIGNGSDIDDDQIPYFEGADKEDFYVTVVLDASEYADPSTGGIKDINQYISPELGDLFSMDTVTAYSQFTKYDGRIKKAFKRTFGSDVPADLEYSDILKSVEINIEEEQDPNIAPKVHYTFSITVTYSYCTKSGNDYIRTGKDISYTFVVADDTIGNAEHVPDFYILYSPFDIHDTTHAGLDARDEITINYRKGKSEADWEKPVNIYLVQQDVQANSTGLDINKIKLNAYTDEETTAKDKYPILDNVEIYSNVPGWQQNVTHGTDAMIQLFEMDVYVWYGKKDTTPINDYLGDDFKAGDYYTKITTIKEEQ